MRTSAVDARELCTADAAVARSTNSRERSSTVRMISVHELKGIQHLISVRLPHLSVLFGLRRALVDATSDCSTWIVYNGKN